MTSIEARIAALRMSEVNRIPSDPPPTYDAAVEERPPPRTKRPPPPLPSRPPRQNASLICRSTATERLTSPGSTRSNSGLISPMSTSSNGSLTPSGNIYSRSTTDMYRPPPSSSMYSYKSVDEEVEVTPALPLRRTSTATVEERAPDLPRRVSAVIVDEPSPRLPPRRPSGATTPAVERRPSYHWQRRGSNESSMSAISMTSGISVGSKRRVLAPEYDAASVPPLPSRRPKDTPPMSPALPTRPSYPSSDTHQVKSPSRRNLPQLPTRPPATIPSPTVPQMQPPPPSKSVPPLPSRPQLPTRPTAPPSARTNGISPPPIPITSRPNLAAISASKPKPNAITTVNCLVCRDFSAPDAHAARYPRESIPTQDVHWLARELTAPFPSLTDKARAIFTWLHHNIAYDVKAFFGNNIKGTTPGDTIATGLAVCDGYAGLFTALALSAGLEALKLTGHGKGIGYVNPDMNNLPPKSMNHAWAAFKMDDGQWKLTDPCWGAGAIMNGSQDFTKKFAPERFTQSNEDFGIDHFPDDSNHFFRADGRSLSWSEYMHLGIDQPRTLGNWETEGWRKQSLEPRGTTIKVSGQAACSNMTVRFMFHKVCPHWDPLKNGDGPNYLPILLIKGRGGDKSEQLPLQSDGYNYWIDVPLADLGIPGQVVDLSYMLLKDGESARGLTAKGYKEYMAQNRAKSWSWGYLCRWDLV